MCSDKAQLQGLGAFSFAFKKSCLDMVLGTLLWVSLPEEGGLDQMSSKDPFQPQVFCDSVKGVVVPHADSSS